MEASGGAEYNTFLPESYTAYRTKIGLGTDATHFLAEQHAVVLNWPYKDCVLEGKQTKESAKHDEVFYNPIIAPAEVNRLFEPKVMTDWTRHDRHGAHPLGRLQAEDNLVIKGNNLIALSSLRQRFANQIKLIYVDVPFNTGSDSFNYNDTFSHSTWLTFMKNRLEIAKQLLKTDGSIFVHADWHEVHYLKVLMDEIFGRENLINEIIWCYTGPGSPKMQQLNRKHDTILWYAIDSENYTFNKDKIRVPYASEYQSMRKSLNAGDGWTEADISRMRERGRVPDDWWSDIAVAARTPADGAKRTGYTTEKPVKLLERIIKMASNPGDVVLDFFAGSGTTAYAAAELGRKFIMIEQLRGAYRLMVERLSDVASFVTCALKNDAQDFCERVQKADSKDLAMLFEELKTAPFLHYTINPEQLNLADFLKLEVANQKRFLLEAVDENSLYVNYADIDDVAYHVDESDKTFNRAFYGD